MLNKNEVKKTHSDESLYNDYANEPVPKDKRNPLISIMAVWFGYTVSISAFLVGGEIGAGLTATKGIAAILIGNLILVVIGTLIGTIGSRTGLTTYGASQLVFGKKGSILSSTILGLTAMLFVGLLMDTFGNTMLVLLPSFPKFGTIMIFAIAITSTSIFGMKGLKTISYVAMPSLWILVGITLYKAVTHAGGWSPIFNTQPTAPITMAHAISLVIATWIGGACLASDISRFAKNTTHIFIGTTFGFLLGTSLFEIIATFAAIGTGEAQFTTIMMSLDLLIPAALITLLALWTTTDNNVYSSSLAFLNVGKLIGFHLPKWAWTIICVIIAVIASTFNFADNFGKFLGYLGPVDTPFAGILIAHFWIINSGKNKLVIPDGFRYTAWITWTVSYVITRLAVVNQASIPVPSGIIGIASGFIIYIILAKTLGKKEGIVAMEYFEY